MPQGTPVPLAAWIACTGECEMSDLSEEEIRKRAYELWKGAGEPSVKMDTFWYGAENNFSPSDRRRASYRPA